MTLPSVRSDRSLDAILTRLVGVPIERSSVSDGFSWRRLDVDVPSMSPSDDTLLLLLLINAGLYVDNCMESI